MNIGKRRELLYDTSQILGHFWHLCFLTSVKSCKVRVSVSFLLKEVLGNTQHSSFLQRREVRCVPPNHDINLERNGHLTRYSTLSARPGPLPGVGEAINSLRR